MGPGGRGAVAFGVLVATLVTPAAASADRPTDKDVKQLIERVDKDRDRFEDQLDGKLKRSIIRGAGGEVNVERYLDDLQENVGKLKDRFTPQYAASAEATAVLRQGAEIQRFMSTQSPGLDGMNEWNRVADSLGQLARAYGTTFPLPEGQQARRFNDAEVKKAAEEVAKGADTYKKELGNALKMDTTIPKPTVQEAAGQVDQLKKAAQRLASTVGGGRPASGDAKTLLQQASAIREVGASRKLTPAAQAAWGTLQSQLAVISQAFNLAPQQP
jgi:hypothetical protein